MGDEGGGRWREMERVRERASQIEVNETEGDGHINEPSRAGAYISISVSSKQILLTMKCNKTKRVLEGRDIPSAFLQRCLALSFSHFLSLRSKIIVFAFICQRSIFQTSDKRGNWTGNRLECCKSTKHNYQKALKELNRIHILKMSQMDVSETIMRTLPHPSSASLHLRAARWSFWS